MRNQGAIDWAATAAWAQAVLSALAIFAAVWLQDRNRHKDRRERVNRMTNAIGAIAGSCVETLEALESKVRQQRLTVGVYDHHADELAADLTSISAIDLTQLDNTALSNEVMKLRRLMRIARRRLERDGDAINGGGSIKRDHFTSLCKEARQAASAIEAMKTSSRV